MVKVSAHLFVVSVVCFSALTAATGAYGFDTAARTGQSIGALLSFIALGLLAAMTARLVRGPQEGVGTMSGIAAIMAFALLSYVGIASH